ncbi:hypothetical protein KM043_018486 [Ampulex compressa]|nr:hypothetical protein KM043_018486 [Ampulex compressa]
MNIRTVSLLIFICVISTAVNCSLGDGRSKRTLPFGLPLPSLPRAIAGLGRLWSWSTPNAAGALVRLIGGPDTRTKMMFEFRPEDGPRAAYAYQQLFGFRGERLIELLGSGFRPNDQPYRQPVPSLFLTPPPPSR